MNLIIPSTVIIDRSGFVMAFDANDYPLACYQGRLGQEEDRDSLRRLAQAITDDVPIRVNHRTTVLPLNRRAFQVFVEEFEEIPVIGGWTPVERGA